MCGACSTKSPFKTLFVDTHEGFQRMGRGGSVTSPTEMHDSPGNRTGGSPQKGIRRLVPGRRGHGFNKTRQPRHELLDAPSVVRPLLHMSAGNVPSVRSKRAREAHHSHSPPRSSTPGRHRSSRPPPTFSRYTMTCSRACNPVYTNPGPCTRTRTPKGSTGHGAPGAGT